MDMLPVLYKFREHKYQRSEVQSKVQFEETNIKGTVVTENFLCSYFSSISLIVLKLTVHANLLTSEGLQMIITERKKILQSEHDQLVERLPSLEAKLTQIEELDAQLEQTEQEKKSHNQGVTQLHAKLAKLKGKQVKLQDVVSSIDKHESASKERIKTLEGNLHSKAEEDTVTNDKRAKIVKNIQKVME